MLKRGFESSFVWIFALVAGAAIIFLAIYASQRLVSTQTSAYDSEIAAQLGTILNPVETNLEESKYYSLELPSGSVVNNKCDSLGTFGTQSITIGSRGVPYSFSNKYLFSNRKIEGPKVGVFVKPLEMPYKIGDLIMIYSQEYCFVSPPEDVAGEIDSLGLNMVNVSANRQRCPKDSVSVCFSGSGCNIMVNREGNSGYVQKNGQTMQFYGPMMYSAIFSDPEIYDCGVKRLRKRAAELAQIYISKGQVLRARGCTAELDAELEMYRQVLLDDSANIYSVSARAESISDSNERLICGLF